MSDIIGQRGTGNVLQANRRPDIASAVAELEPESAPLTVLVNRLNSTPTVNPEYKHFEDDLEPRFDAIDNGGGYTSADTALAVDNGAYYHEHGLVLVTRTKEMLRVTSVVGDTINVVRGVGSTAAALLDDDELLLVGTAMQEGDTSRPARSSNPTPITNYCQIHRTPYAATNTNRASATWTQPTDWTRTAKKAGIEHAKDQEYVAWHGKPSETLAGEHPRRTTGGFFHHVTTNVTDAGGAFTEAEFFAALRPNFRYGKKRKAGFGSMLAVDVLNGYARGKLEIQQGEAQYGLAVMEYITPHGTLRLVTSYLFEGDVYGGVLAIADVDNIGKRYLASPDESRDTHVVENIQENDRDGRKDEILTECGMQVMQEKTHGYVYGITG
jgi:hypothetical protein